MSAAIAEMVSGGLTLLTLLAIFFLLFGRNAARRVRQAWRAGYWTGKKELQQSLAAHLAFYEAELAADVDLLGPVLLSWVQREHLANQALARIQGIESSERALV